MEGEGKEEMREGEKRGKNGEHGSSTVTRGTTRFTLFSDGFPPDFSRIEPNNHSQFSFRPSLFMFHPKNFEIWRWFGKKRTVGSVLKIPA